VLNLGALFYGWLIAMMAGTAAALALSDPRFTPDGDWRRICLDLDIILGNRELRDNGWFHSSRWCGCCTSPGKACNLCWLPVKRQLSARLGVIPHERTQRHWQPLPNNSSMSATCVRC
jgi:hypothetical protein